METAHTSTGARPPAGNGELVLGRYELVERLGSGGFGVVWAARDARLDRDVALKRIAVDDPAVARRAAREAKAAARLSHPGIVALYEAGRDADAVYLVSELVCGHTLARLLADGALSDRDIVGIGTVLCAALTHAHRRGVVHRDVKPQNVIIPEAPADGHGVAKLTDFGIARLLGEDVLTRTGDIVGTLAYMAPEQAEGRRGHRTGRPVRARPRPLRGAVWGQPGAGSHPGLDSPQGRRAPAAAAAPASRPAPRAVRRDRRRRPARPGGPRALGGPAPRAAGRARGGGRRGRHGRGRPAESVTRVAGMAVRAHGAEPAWTARRRGRSRVRDDDGDERDEARVGASATAAGPERLPARAVAAFGTGALTAAALGGLGPVPPITPLGGAVLAAAAVAILPRLGSLAVTAALAAWLITATAHGNGAGLAVLVVAAALPAVALTWKAAAGWRPRRRSHPS